MRFGVYVHIPYCLQRCPYCDFATFEIGTVAGPDQYLELLLNEIRLRANRVPYRAIDSIYFGGGTPSLMEPEYLIRILDVLREQGLQIKSDAEVTMEINPATLDPSKIERCIRGGFNRFSVGAQSFDDRLLKIAGRRHNSRDTIETLQLLKSFGVKYSFDLLFALPTQTLDQLNLDLDRVGEFSPGHLSAYCLTVPEGNPLHLGRPHDDVQAEMFFLVNRRLADFGLKRYEVSNWSKPGAESRHNLLYWDDHPYWGIGLSAHSYFKDSTWGRRFWNHSGMTAYGNQIEREQELFKKHLKDESPEYLLKSIDEALPVNNKELLELNEALTDYCHISLRKTSGLEENLFRMKFGEALWKMVVSRAPDLEGRGLLFRTATGYALTEQGWLLSNLVFKSLTFSTGELSSEIS